MIVVWYTHTHTQQFISILFLLYFIYFFDFIISRMFFLFWGCCRGGWVGGWGLDRSFDIFDN